MSSTQGVSTLILQAVLRAAGRRGLDPDELLAKVGLDPNKVRDPYELVPIDREDALWREVYARTGDQAFGLEAAQAIDRGSFLALEYVVRTSQTLGEGLRVLERFARLLHGHRPYELRSEPDGSAVLAYRDSHDGDVHAALLCDFALAAVVLICRDATGVDWSPRRVRFRHEKPNHVRPYRALFRAPVEFGCDETAIELDPEVLSTPMTEADPALQAVLQHYLEADLETRDPSVTLEHAVRVAIGRSLPKQDAELDAVAEVLGVSPRVLQKRLQRVGTSFQEQLDRVRESLAKRYLVQPGISMAGTALLLGYSDATAFHRAFKRWTGLTPGDYRRRARGAP